LYRNCRNTAEISKSLSNIGEIKTQGYVNENHGDKPIVQFCTNQEDIVAAVKSFINQSFGEGLSLTDMVILTTHTLKSSMLTNLAAIGDWQISNKPELGKVWFTTVRRFKGLEAKAVLILDVKTSELTQEITRNLLYVGSSRATLKLKLLILDDVRRKDYPVALAALGDKIERRKDIADWLGMDIKE
jgi:superfamily I DNA/RNA helicase